MLRLGWRILRWPVPFSLWYGGLLALTALLLTLSMLGECLMIGHEWSQVTRMPPQSPQVDAKEWQWENQCGLFVYLGTIAIGWQSQAIPTWSHCEDAWLTEPVTERSRWRFLGFSGGLAAGGAWSSFAVGEIVNWSGSSRATRIRIPLWMTIGLLALLPLVRFTRARRASRRAAAGCCLNCGYDLRASPTRCPECGKHARSRMN
jgi:hypothetical protein